MKKGVVGWCYHKTNIQRYIKVIYVNMATRQRHAHLVFGPKVLLKFTLVTLINKNQYHLPDHIHFISIPIAIELKGKFRSADGLLFYYFFFMEYIYMIYVE